MIRFVTPAMHERSGGRLIQISAATTPTLGSPPEYPASKAAVLNLTLSVSMALAGNAVTANTVSPGMISTQSIDACLANLGHNHGWGNDDRGRSEQLVLDIYLPQTVRRVGLVSDISSMLACLASPAADSVNGANFRVDGGTSQFIN
jgi:3-oxoacyl-[acyl-carrier protein] reductase